MHKYLAISNPVKASELNFSIFSIKQILRQNIALIIIIPS